MIGQGSPEPLVGLSEVSFVGRGLQRPECVLCTAAGDVIASNWSGGLTRLDETGHQTELRATRDPWLRPNGIALQQNGSVLLAHLGDDTGGVFELHRDGSLDAFLTEVDGVPLPPTNFVVSDELGRTWITISTSRRPRADAYRPDVADGFIVLVDPRGARVVADGLAYTNEAIVNPAGTHLYVNETFGRRTSRFRINANGSLGNRETVTEYGHGVFPDGLAFDEDGSAWVVSVVSNRIVRVGHDGHQTLILDDADRDHVDRAEAAFEAGALGRPHLDSIGGSTLQNVSSLAFGGHDRRTVYLGCLLGDSIATFRSPVAGARPSHWNVTW